MKKNSTAFSKRSCYEFIDEWFDVLIIFNNDNIDLIEPIQSKIASTIHDVVDRFLNCEPEDYEMDLDSMITNELINLRLFNVRVQTIRLGKVENIYD